MGFAGIMLREIFGDKLTGKAGGTIDNDVEFRRRLHMQFLDSWFRHCEEQSDEAIHSLVAGLWIASLRSQCTAYWNGQLLPGVRDAHAGAHVALDAIGRDRIAQPVLRTRLH